MRFDLETTASPAQVLRAMTDFSARRPEIWSRSLDARAYQVLDRGDSWAEAREATSGSPFWIVSRYDWPEPGVVRWVVTDASYGGSGEGFMSVAPGADGGSHVHAEWTLTDPTRQKAMLWIYRHLPMAPVIRRLWVRAFEAFGNADNSALE